MWVTRCKAFGSSFWDARWIIVTSVMAVFLLGGCGPVHEAQEQTTIENPGGLSCSIEYDLSKRRIEATVANDTDKMLSVGGFFVRVERAANDAKVSARITNPGVGSGHSPALVVYSNQPQARIYMETGMPFPFRIGGVWLVPGTRAVFSIDDDVALAFKGETEFRVSVKVWALPATLAGGQAPWSTAAEVEVTSKPILVKIPSEGSHQGNGEE